MIARRPSDEISQILSAASALALAVAALAVLGLAAPLNTGASPPTPAQSEPGKLQPLMLIMSQDDLAAKINAALAGGPDDAPIRNVSFDISAGRMAVSGQAMADGQAVPFVTEVVPVLNGGKPQLVVAFLDFGPVPVPETLRQSVASSVGQLDLLGGLPLTVASLRAEPGRLVLEGRTRLA